MTLHTHVLQRTQELMAPASLPESDWHARHQSIQEHHHCTSTKRARTRRISCMQVSNPQPNPQIWQIIGESYLSPCKWSLQSLQRLLDLSAELTLTFKPNSTARSSKSTDLRSLMYWMKFARASCTCVPASSATVKLSLTCGQGSQCCTEQDTTLCLDHKGAATLLVFMGKLATTSPDLCLGLDVAATVWNAGSGKSSELSLAK